MSFASADDFEEVSGFLSSLNLTTQSEFLAKLIKLTFNDMLKDPSVNKYKNNSVRLITLVRLSIVLFGLDLADMVLSDATDKIIIWLKIIGTEHRVPSIAESDLIQGIVQKLRDIHKNVDKGVLITLRRKKIESIPYLKELIVTTISIQNRIQPKSADFYRKKSLADFKDDDEIIRRLFD